MPYLSSIMMPQEPPDESVKMRITYYAPPDVIDSIEYLIKEGRGNSKSDLISFAIKEYAHRVKMEKCSELEEAYPLLEQRLAVLEEKYASLISVLSSLQPKEYGNK